MMIKRNYEGTEALMTLTIKELGMILFALDLAAVESRSSDIRNEAADLRNQIIGSTVKATQEQMNYSEKE